ncbi:MAG: hypothetical protein AD073_000022 [Mycoplasmataceae bacterium]|nr:MAG: hypothetical protein AD073_000022 [Mycoplasmataceae bacterium]
MIVVNNRLVRLIINPKVKRKLNHFNYDKGLEIIFSDNKKDSDNNSVSSLWKNLIKQIEKVSISKSSNLDERQQLLLIEE